MSTSQDKPFELTVLPKGRHGEMLTVTLTFAPNAKLLDWRRDHLPRLLLSAGKVQFLMHNGQDRLVPSPAVAPPTDFADLLQPNLWDKVFAGVVPAEVESALNAKAPQRLYFSAAAAHLSVSGFAASSMQLFINAEQRARNYHGSHIRTAPSALEVLSGMASNDLHKSRLGNDLRDVQSHFLRAGHSLEEVVEDMQSLHQQMAEADPQLISLMAGYLPDLADRETSPSKVVRDLLRHLGMKSGALSLLRDGLKGMKAADDLDVRALVGPIRLMRAWGRSALATAPYRPSDGQSATLAHDDKDKESVENRLAAIAQEFAILPFLGLVVDMDIPLESLGPRALVEQALASDAAFISAEWIGLENKVITRRTAIGSDGRPRARKRPSDDLDAYIKEGRADMSAAMLSNLETHGNIANTISAALQTLAGADGFVRGEAAAKARLVIAALRSGPLTVQHHFFRMFFDKVTSNDPPDTDKYLDELVIGVRPDVRVHMPGNQSTWRALMDREVTYEEIPEQVVALSMRHATARTRGEGFVPLARHAYSGSANDPSVVVSDTVFEWSGWNPAVPFPSKFGKVKAPLVRKTIRAKPRTNPRFRYGAGVEVSARVVLRDGSSISSESKGAAHAMVASKQLDQNLLDQRFSLLRYEPLRAPTALLTDDFAHGSLGKLQTATHVVLAQPQWGCGMGCYRSSRYLLAGEVHDLVELDKLGAFDRGSCPTDSAFHYFERDANGAFPAINAGSGQQAVVRPRLDGARSPVPYHPDPMVKRLRVFIARQHSSGDLVCARDSSDGSDGSEYVHELYGRWTHWPHARPLRVDFVAANPTSAPPGIRKIGALPYENAIEIIVPTGENFEVLIFPEGDDDDMKARQYGRRCGMPMDSPFVCEMLQLHVENLAVVPQTPRLEEIVDPARDSGEHIGRFGVVAHVDAGATAVLELVASWSDPGDNPAMGKLKHGNMPPVNRRGEMVVEDLSSMLRKQVDEMIRDGQPIDRGLVRVEFTGLLHDMRDNRRREITYSLRAQSAATLGRRAKAPVTSNPQLVDWPATRCPAPPLFLNIAPAFRFRRSRELRLSTSVREQAICLFFGRDWGTSGPGELVGIVCEVPGRATDKAVSQWGTDPTRMTGVIDRKNMVATDFISSPQSVTDSRAHAAAAEGITLYQPTYDEDEDAWRVDLRLNTWWPEMEFHGRPLTSGIPPAGHVPLAVAQPMLRFVAIRYQPHAFGNEQASERVLVDYLQLPSQRAATAVIHAGGDSVSVTIYGPMGSGSDQGGQPELSCSLMTGEVSGRGALVWREALIDAQLLPAVENGQYERNALRWIAELPIPIWLRRKRVGLRLTERTVYLVGKSGTEKAPGPPMYQEVMELRLIDGRDPS